MSIHAHGYLALALASALGFAGAYAQDSAPPAEPSSLEFSAGGTALSRGSLSLASLSDIGGTSVLRPLLALSRSKAELRFEPRLRFGTEGGAELDVDELSLELKHGDDFDLEAGRFAPEPGPAFLLSNVDYFAALDFERLIEEGPSRARLPDDLLQARYATGPWRLEASFAPLSPDFHDAPSDSPWIPLGHMQDSYASLFGTTSYELRDVAWAEENAARVLDPAFSARAALAGPAWELALSYFQGGDREPSLNAQSVPLDVSDPGFFDLELRHEAARVQKAGLAGHLDEGSLSAWVDASWFQGRLLTVGSPYATPDYWQPTLSSGGVDYSLGASLRLPLPESSLRLEWRNAWYAQDVSSANPPFLERAAAAAAAAYLPSGEAGIEALGLYSLDDGSWLFDPKIEWRFAGGKTLDLDFLIFGGGTSTELGRYAASNQARLSLALAF